MFWFFFLVLGKTQIQIPSFKADEGLVLLKTMPFIWMLSYELRSLNPRLVFAIQYRLLVVSQALLFSIFIDTTPLSAETLQLSGNTTDSTLRVAAKHWNPKTLSQNIVPNQCCPFKFGETLHNISRICPIKITSIAVFFILQQEALVLCYFKYNGPLK